MNSILQSRLQKNTSGCILLLLVNILYKVILNSIWRSLMARYSIFELLSNYTQIFICKLFHKISTFRWFLKILYETFPSCILTPAPYGFNGSLSIQVTNIDQNTPPWSTASRPSTPRFTVGMETTFYSKFIRNIHVDDSYKSSNFTYILLWHTKSNITLILINLSL